MTSYFYQIRFFTPNMIPLSTAVWDPKWFHANRGQDYHFKDKNGVWNGLRAEPFMPGEMCNGLCQGKEVCDIKDPDKCLFLKTYKYQLNQLNYDEIISRFERMGNFIQELEGFEEESILVLIVHEAYNNPCSERWVIQDWFKEHGYDIKEFKFG